MQMSAVIAGSIAVAAIGGVIRGATGFGGAMVMTPTMSLLLGPIPAVVIALLLETFAAFKMIPTAVRTANWSTIAPIGAAACMTAPLGGYLLMTLDPQLMRRAIAATVVVFSLLLLAGLRYRGTQRVGTSIALGALSGVLVGATSVGAPPVIVYLLASSDRSEVTRANLTLFVTIISLAALIVMTWNGMLDRTNALRALALSPCYFGGVWLGNHLFGRVNASVMRLWTLIFLVIVSATVLAL
jgi:uncharacterized membrane protein YfcA